MWQHKFIIYVACQQARADNLTICYRKNQLMSVFLCICPVVENEFCHKIVNESSLWIHSAIDSWIHRYFDNVTTKLIINNRTDA